ncbi:acyl-coenzyme A thioesterase PaaI-like protein [Pontibacter ummariensis]|uniref:Acyl-coenzyme A thioesterase PaaI, contains HGG motif n=1 Tax=Pontibacter ummariensis TaxID=1610492 RepID=A0A239HG44_9BACT|nr:DUF4442 domain-containing protein [Pontibacter ummariensis]PRY10596.1 acyl-coenzyme A thioesterase PaaI-like protein [Pontibacter ummariensis]SNS80379.1 Acyl-coenzyme A thioesterase PaaI, contains HGG motif [Pontibacter ummariensis]
MNSQKDPTAAFRDLIGSPTKLRLFMLAKLPMAYLAGLRVTSLTQEQATVSIKYQYLNKNPFGSIYFACLSMAAELSTGVLCMMNTYQSDPAVSMLVVHMEADFTKKAAGTVAFTCEDGKPFQEAVAQTKATGEGVTVTVSSIGLDEKGEQVAIFRFIWSLKAKNKPLA